MKKNPTASEMAKIRWAKTTRQERRAHALMMVQARKKPKAPVLKRP